MSWVTWLPKSTMRMESLGWVMRPDSRCGRQGKSQRRFHCTEPRTPMVRARSSPHRLDCQPRPFGNERPGVGGLAADLLGRPAGTMPRAGLDPNEMGLGAAIGKPDRRGSIEAGPWHD